MTDEMPDTDDGPTLSDEMPDTDDGPTLSDETPGASESVDLAGEREFLQYHIDEHGFLSWLGATVDSIEADRIVMTIPYDEKLTNSGPGNGESDDGRDSVHGGIAATLIDTCGGLAVRAALDNPISSGVATIDLNVSYLRPAKDDLVATADVVRVGSTVGVSEVSVVSETGDGTKEVAVGRGSFRIFSP